MTKVALDGRSTPNLISRIRSRQSGNPSGLLGRIVGRAMVKDTWAANARCLELLGDVDGRTILELGFGQGKMVAALADSGASVIGAEPSATMLAQATARNREAIESGSVDLRPSDGVRIPFDDEIADAATTAHTIYFMEDPATTFAEVHRVLRPGGHVVVAFLAADDGIEAWKDPAVYRAVRTVDVERLLADAGFTAVETHLDIDRAGDARWTVGIA